jgi:hypothetical protein
MSKAKLSMGGLPPWGSLPVISGLRGAQLISDPFEQHAGVPIIDLVGSFHSAINHAVPYSTVVSTKYVAASASSVELTLARSDFFTPTAEPAAAVPMILIDVGSPLLTSVNAAVYTVKLKYVGSGVGAKLDGKEETIEFSFRATENKVSISYHFARVYQGVTSAEVALIGAAAADATLNNPDDAGGDTFPPLTVTVEGLPEKAVVSVIVPGLDNQIYKLLLTRMAMWMSL